MGMRAHQKAEINDKPLFGTLPVVAKFHTTGDAIVLGLKHSISGEYLWAVRVESLMEWTPPSDPKKDVEEDALMFPLRLPHSDLIEFTPVVNTDSHRRLRAQLDKLISHLPTLRAAKIRSIADLEKFAQMGYEKSIKAALLACTLL